MKITERIVISLSVAALIILSVALYGRYYYQSVNLVPSIAAHLSQMAKERSLAVINLLYKKEDFLKSMAHEPKVLSFLTGTMKDTSHLNDFFAHMQESTGFLNMLLIKPDGTVAFSLKEPKKLAINLKKTPYSNTSLGRSFNRSILTMTPDVANFSFDMVLKTPSLYSTIPVLSADKKFIGVLGVQLDMKEIFALTDNYFNLGTTGDVILAQRLAQGAQIIAPTRNNPEIAFNVIDFQIGEPTNPIEYAVRGKQGSSQDLSYQGHKVVAAWSYIPPLAWGIALTIDLDEARKPIETTLLLFYGSLGLFAILMLLIIVIKREHLAASLERYSKISASSFLLIVGIVICMTIFGIASYYFYSLKTNALLRAHTMAQEKVDTATQKISKEIENIVSRATYIAQDLSAGRLMKKDIEIRMERDIKENSLLYGLIIAYAPRAYSSDKPLYAPHVVKTKDGVKKQMLNETFDYSQQVGVIAREADWYQKGMKEGASWLEPTADPLTKKLVAQYVVPFYDTQDSKKSSPIGVIVAEFAVDSLPLFAQKVNIGQTSYSFMLSKGGSFIYHPNKQLVTDKQSIFNYAQKINNKKLYNLGESLIKGQSGRSSFIDPVTNQTTYIHYATIPQSPWSIALVFVEDEVQVPSETIRHLFIALISCLVLAAIFLMLFLVRLLIISSKRDEYIAVISSIIMLIGIGMLWEIMRKTVGQESEQSNAIVIGNQASLTAFVDLQRQKAATKFKNFITIPTGILINSVTFPDEQQVAISAYVWQHYHASYGIEQKILIPGSRDLSLEKIQEQKKGDLTIVGWKVTATIPQKFSITQYPFDHRSIIIPIAHPLQNVSIALIPNFNDYELFYKTDYLGITKSFSFSEFDLEGTHFMYKPIEQQVSLLESSIEEPLEMHFVIQLTRKTLNAFIIYFIPLLVILFTLFATIAFTHISDAITSTAIIPYTAPLFALIVLHGNLRRSYNIGGILYIEYLFFLTYLTILFAVSFNILISNKNLLPTDRLAKISRLLNIYFWPGQFVLWYVATVIAFR